ncbi:hypothetical protein AAFF_G00289200, partial [Aldrovandia affinis]
AALPLIEVTTWCVTITPINQRKHRPTYSDQSPQRESPSVVKMAAADYRRLHLFNMSLHRCLADASACDHARLLYGNATDILDLDVPGDGSPWLRAAIAAVYFTVSAVGMAGNTVVLYLLRASGGAAQSTVNFLIFNLAVTDLLFSAVMPLWAADTALDYRWPFGECACKLASFLTSLNLFASVFFLAAMSVTRYCSV